MQHAIRNYWRYAAIASCALLGLGAGYLLHGSDPARQTPEAFHASDGTNGTSARDAPGFALGPGLLAPPSTQTAVSEPAGAASPFQYDRNGNLLVDEMTEAVLDRFLSTLPSSPTAAQLQTLEEQVRIGLPREAAARAVALMRAYIDYRQADYQLAQEPEPEGMAEMRIAAEKRIGLRRTYFDRDMADAIFGARESQQLYSLEVMRIMADDTLTPDEKRRAVKSLHAALPPRVAADEFNRADGFSVELEERVASLRLRGVPDAEIRRVRLQHFGVEEAPPAGPPGR